MRFEIHTDRYETLPQEATIRLALRRSYTGDVKVVLVDEQGEQLDQGNLVTFRRDGTLFLHGGVNQGTDFEKDSTGRILTG